MGWGNYPALVYTKVNEFMSYVSKFTTNDPALVAVQSQKFP